MSAKYKSPSFLLPNELNTSANPANNTGVNSLYSMDFATSDNRGIYCGPVPTMFIGDSSVSVWFNSEVNNTQNVIFNRHTAGTGNFNDTYVLRNEASGSGVKIKLELGNPLKSFYSQNVYSKSVWHHLAVTLSYSSGQYTVKFYIDGVEDSPTNSPMTMPTMSSNSTLPLTIGAQRSGSNFVQGFKGDIDEVAIFNRALDSTEINALYGGTSPNIYPSNLMATNLNPIAYYPLGEQAQMQGYLGNEASSEWQFPNGVLQDYVMDFDGSTDYIDVDTISLGTTFTLSCWVNFDSFSASTNVVFGGGASYYALYVPNSTTVWAYFGAGSYFTVPTLSGWNNLIFTRNGATGELFLNGQSQGTNATYGTNNFDLKFIGCENQGVSTKYYLDGKLSNTAVWNTAITDANQIANIYNNGSPQTTYTVSPQNWWKLNADSVYTPSAPNYTTALDFTSTGTKIDLGLESSLGLGGASKYSTSLWFKKSGNGTNCLWGYNYGDASGSGWYYWFNSGSLRIATGKNGLTSGFGYYEISSNSLPLGKWQHILVVFDGTLSAGDNRIKVYHNGANAVGTYFNSTNFPATLPNGNGASNRNAYLGQLQLGGGSFSYNYDGQLSNVQQWNTDLSSSDAATLFNYGSPIQTLSNIPQNSNLKAWWKLDDQTAITDSSNNGNTGTNNGATDISSGVAYVPSWKIPTALPIPSINYTTALNFDGTSDYISVPSSLPPSGTSNFAISGWFYRDSTSSTAAVYFDKVQGTNFLVREAGSSGTIEIFADGTNYNYSSLSTYNTANAWHHIAISYDGSNLTVYVDTNKLSQSATGLNISSTSDMRIGARSNSHSASFFKGFISNVAIYNTNLTDSNVSTLYNNGQPQVTIFGSPQAWYKLDSTTITDSSGNGYTGANNGTTQVTSDVFSGVIPSNGVSTTLPSTALQQSDLQFDSPYSNYSLSLDGTGDYIDCTNDSILTPTSAISISLWVKTNDSANFASLIDKWINNNTGYMIHLGTSANQGKPMFQIGATVISSSVIVNDGDWHHVCVTCDNTTGYIYVDGVQTGTGSLTMTGISSLDNLKIGGDGLSGPYLIGKIDETALWSTALTSAQVLEIYNNGRPKDLSTFSGTAPVSWWRLGENAYFNDVPAFTVPNSITGAPNGTGSGSITSMLSADAPGTYANGIGTNLVILDRVGDATLSTSNSQSYNMIPSDISPYVPEYVGTTIANAASMTFDGIDDYFNADGSVLPTGNSSFTTSCWFKRDGTQANYAGILSWGNTTSQRQSVYINFASGGTSLKFGFYSDDLGSSGYYATSDNVWYNVVLAYNGSIAKMYVNGSLQASHTLGGALNISSSNPITIGKTNTYYFKGEIDEVAIFNYALNAGQIYNDIYLPTKSGTGLTANLDNNPNLTAPVAWYRMGD